MTPSNTDESTLRTSVFSSPEKNSVIRSTVFAAPAVCSVERTRCPASAAASAVLSVSLSRISPMRMQSGSCLKEATSPALKDATSRPTSRCRIIERLLTCTYSIGSSIVMIL